MYFLVLTFWKQARYFSFNAFAFLAALRTLDQPRLWHSENETQQSSYFVVHLGTAQKNPTDSTFKFDSRCSILIWPKVQLALHRNDL